MCHTLQFSQGRCISERSCWTSISAEIWRHGFRKVAVRVLKDHCQLQSRTTPKNLAERRELLGQQSVTSTKTRILVSFERIGGQTSVVSQWRRGIGTCSLELESVKHVSSVSRDWVENWVAEMFCRSLTSVQYGIEKPVANVLWTLLIMKTASFLQFLCN